MQAWRLEQEKFFLPFLVNCNRIFNILTAGTNLPGLKEGTEKELNVVMLKMVAALTARSVRNTGEEYTLTELPSYLVVSGLGLKEHQQIF